MDQCITFGQDGVWVVGIAGEHDLVRESQSVHSTLKLRAQSTITYKEESGARVGAHQFVHCLDQGGVSLPGDQAGQHAEGKRFARDR